MKKQKNDNAGPPELTALLTLPTATPKKKRLTMGAARKELAAVIAPSAPGFRTVGEAPAKKPATPQVEAPWSKHGRKKPEPTVAARTEGKPLPEAVPAWVASAETGPSLANAVEPATKPQDEPAAKPERKAKAKQPKPAAKPKGAAKAKPPKVTMAAYVAASAGSVAAVAGAWLKAIAKAGHTPSTVKTYERAVELAIGFFGAETTIEKALKRLEAFNESDACLKKKNGKAKAKPSILQVQRAVRMALEHGIPKKAVAS